MSDASLLKPDREFIDRLMASGGESLKQCFQCATCSVVCELSPDHRPFPRKEMIWAQWGLKDRLLVDPDVWLCYQCNDCSTHCPRNARPADVLGAVRRESVIHYAVPRFLARWVNEPKYLPLLLLIPAVLLGLALWLRAPMERALGIAQETGSGKIVFSYWNLLPHWLLIGFFTFFSLLALLAMIAGAVRFWGALKAADAKAGNTTPAKGIGPSIAATLKNIFTHNDFTSCTTARSRALSHYFVFYGFIALALVAFWVVTIRINPLAQGDLVYPFNFWNPWRMLANLAGGVLLVGCLLMIYERLKRAERGDTNTYFDWAFLGTLFAVVLTGFGSEVLHYARMEPHRQIVYFVHLVCVFGLLMYLPYSKFAHLVYRATAMVYAEHMGRKAAAPAAAPAEQAQGEAAGS